MPETHCQGGGGTDGRDNEGGGSRGKYCSIKARLSGGKGRYLTPRSKAWGAGYSGVIRCPESLSEDCSFCLKAPRPHGPRSPITLISSQSVFLCGFFCRIASTNPPLQLKALVVERFRLGIKFCIILCTMRRTHAQMLTTNAGPSSHYCIKMRFLGPGLKRRHAMADVQVDAGNASAGIPHTGRRSRRFRGPDGRISM